MTKYVGRYFYFSAYNYFYKTNSNFEMIDYYTSQGNYGQFAYDSSSSKFYVADVHLKKIDVFNESCSLLMSISLDQEIWALALFKRNIYAGFKDSNQILVLNHGTVIKTVTAYQCYNGTSSITVDSFGSMAISCAIPINLVIIYDSDGIYMNSQILKSSMPWITAIDSSSRLVAMSSESIDIYY